MFGYNKMSVIERNGVVGIICGWDGSMASVMFEDGSHGVSFANYPLSAISRFKVIG